MLTVSHFDIFPMPLLPLLYIPLPVYFLLLYFDLEIQSSNLTRIQRHYLTKGLGLYVYLILNELEV